MLTIHEIKGDLFTAPDGFAFVHCISSDCAMGAGIATRFRDMGVKDMLMSAADGGSLHWDGHGYCLTAYTDDGRRVYNLVTKNRYWEKPTYTTLRESLVALRRRLVGCHSKLAMPRIGCGLDKLEWERVCEIICQVFRDTDAEITIYYLQED